MRLRGAQAAAGCLADGGGSELLEPVEVCGRTVVTGAGGAAVRVVVPRDAVLAGDVEGFVDRFASIQLEGSGPMLGFALADNVSPEEGGQYLAAIRLGAGYHHIIQDFISTTLTETQRGRYVVPAGVYTLYLISDGSPVTVVLPFEDLQGETRAAASRLADLDFHVLDNHLDPQRTGQQHAYSVGAGKAHAGSGLAMMAMDLQLPVADVESSGVCYYSAKPRDDSTAYLPGCPARFTEDNDAFEFLFFPGPTLSDGQLFATSPSGPGGQGLGMWRLGANPQVRIASVAFFLAYE